MTLNDAIARDPPRRRRLRLLAPVLILLALALLAMAPGILSQIGGSPDDEPAQSVDQIMTYEGR
jgi:hypothetical protein